MRKRCPLPPRAVTKFMTIENLALPIICYSTWESKLCTTHWQQVLHMTGAGRLALTEYEKASMAFYVLSGNISKRKISPPLYPHQQW